MPRRDNIKKANVILGKELAESLADKIKSRQFSQESRIAVRELNELYDKSKAQFTDRVSKLLAGIDRVRNRGIYKRLAVEFNKEDILKLNEAVKYLNASGTKITQKELIMGAIMDKKE